MMRLIASIVLELCANAIGLFIAQWLLAPNMQISGTGFVIVVAIFSAVRFILAPLVTRLSMRYARVLMGGISLVVILAALLVTSLLTSHLAITGFSTWILATLIIWVFGVIAMLVLPMVIFKETLAEARSGKQPNIR